MAGGRSCRRSHGRRERETKSARGGIAAADGGARPDGRRSAAFARPAPALSRRLSESPAVTCCERLLGRRVVCAGLPLRAPPPPFATPAPCPHPARARPLLYPQLPAGRRLPRHAVRRCRRAPPNVSCFVIAVLNPDGAATIPVQSSSPVPLPPPPCVDLGLTLHRAPPTPHACARTRTHSATQTATHAPRCPHPAAGRHFGYCWLRRRRGI
jgi:hypothetical protein